MRGYAPSEGRDSSPKHCETRPGSPGAVWREIQPSSGLSSMNKMRLFLKTVPRLSLGKTQDQHKRPSVFVCFFMYAYICIF